jgi:hypothetical protein
MGFWVIPAAICAGLTIWGAAIGRGAWLIPALALLAYAGVRGIVSLLPQGVHEVAICTLGCVFAPQWLDFPTGRCLPFFGPFPR